MCVHLYSITPVCTGLCYRTECYCSMCYCLRLAQTSSPPPSILRNFIFSCSLQNSTSATIEEELGLVGASAEDDEAEHIRKVCEKEVLVGKFILCFIWAITAAFLKPSFCI